jgi:hypothetical protein
MAVDIKLPTPPPSCEGPCGKQAYNDGLTQDKQQMSYIKVATGGKKKYKLRGGGTIQAQPLSSTAGMPKGTQTSYKTSLTTLVTAESNAEFDEKAFYKNPPSTGGKRRTKKTRKSGKRKTRRNSRHRSKRRR